MKTIQEQIAVMQHYANGGKVEYKTIGASPWDSTPNPQWNWTGTDYRIAQPTTFKMWQWIVQTNTEKTCYLTNHFYATKEEATAWNKPFTILKPALWTEIEL